jgi:tetratricopeptide (TPR) repeat protein
MRASGEGRRRLLALMSVIATLFGGTVVAGRITAARHPAPQLDFDQSDSPLSEERREKLRQLQKIVTRLRKEARQENWDTVITIADRDAYRSGLLRALKAEAQARRGRHEEATATLQTLYKTHADPSLFLLSGQRAEYDLLVDRDLATVASETNMAGPYIHAAWIITLTPTSPVPHARVQQLARQGVTLAELPATIQNRISFPSPLARRSTSQPDKADALRVLGVALFREGKYQEALLTLRDSEALRPSPHVWVFMALSLRKLGRGEEAARWEKELHRYMNQTFGAQARPTEFYLYLRELDSARPV